MQTLAFEYLMEKKSSRQNKTSLKYDNLNMAKYLQEDNFGYSIQGQQNMEV